MLLNVQMNGGSLPAQTITDRPQSDQLTALGLDRRGNSSTRGQARSSERRVPLYSDLNSKYDLFGLRIKSYHYVPSSDQTDKDVTSNQD